MGVAATMLAAASLVGRPPPCRRGPPSPAPVRARPAAVVEGVALASLALLAVGVVLLLIPAPGLTLSFAGTFAVIVGIGMQTPLVTKLLMDGVTPLSSRLGRRAGPHGPAERGQSA